ncbi:MAG: lysoplasmalogenase [Meiothermus ruber]|nr:lysoplasmalogenase [Meiothermus ruber]
MNDWIWGVLGLGGLSLVGLLWAEWQSRRAARVLFKSLCSLGFLLFALGLGVEGWFAQLVLAGLVLSAVGDVLLLFGSSRAFLAGLGAFLLAHLAYLGAFVQVGTPSLGGLLLVLAMGYGWLRWLWPHLGGWKAPVLAYGVIISLMLWAGLGTARSEIWLGALLFYLSDLFVARQRFVVRQPLNPLLGLPLYYAAQYLLAWAAR